MLKTDHFSIQPQQPVPHRSLLEPLEVKFDLAAEIRPDLADQVNTMLTDISHLSLAANFLSILIPEDEESFQFELQTFTSSLFLRRGNFLASKTGLMIRSKTSFTKLLHL